MKQIKSILVVIDRRDEAGGLVRKAVALARQCSADIELFQCDSEAAYEIAHAYNREAIDKSCADIVSRAHAYLLELKANAQASGVSIEIDARCESPLYEAVVRKVLRSGPSLVMKARPRRGKALDPNDWQLMRTCPAALMLSGPRKWRSPPLFGAVVDVSDDETAGLPREVLKTALLLAAPWGVGTEVIYGEAAGAGVRAGAERLRSLCETVSIAPEHAHVVYGSPADSLSQFTSHHGYDILVLGALGHRSDLAQVGTLTSKLLDTSDCDFVLVKPAGYHSPLEREIGNPQPRPASGGNPARPGSRDS
ncbi:MAG: universal stress protein [Proteobacteria bacterium]|nr:universal stress protein [Pseudomonadota bacterium]